MSKFWIPNYLFCWKSLFFHIFISHFVEIHYYFTLLAEKGEEKQFSISFSQYGFQQCSTMYITHCILYIIHCILYIAYYTLYIIHCILYIVYCINGGKLFCSMRKHKKDVIYNSGAGRHKGTFILVVVLTFPSCTIIWQQLQQLQLPHSFQSKRILHQKSVKKNYQ